MNKKPWKTYALWILICEAVGFLAGILTRQGTIEYTKTALKPPLTPPGWLFPVAWGILYGLMGIGAARITLASPSAQRSRGLNWMVTQLIVNFFWPLLFFRAGAYGISLLWLLLLWGSVLGMILAWRKVDPAAARLQIPYILWLSFAVYLNLGVWCLNP